jgi:hypothetical protein
VIEASELEPRLGCRSCIGSARRSWRDARRVDDRSVISGIRQLLALLRHGEMRAQMPLSTLKRTPVSECVVYDFMTSVIPPGAAGGAGRACFPRGQA